MSTESRALKEEPIVNNTEPGVIDEPQANGGATSSILNDLAEDNKAATASQQNNAQSQTDTDQLQKTIKTLESEVEQLREKLKVLEKPLEKVPEKPKSEGLKPEDAAAATEYDPVAETTRVPDHQWRSTKSKTLGKTGTAVLIAVVPRTHNVDTYTQSGPEHHEDGKAPVTVDDQANLPRDIPTKFAINSQRLMKSISKRTKQEIFSDFNVWVRPFKYLLHYENEIRAGYQEISDRHAKLLSKEKETEKLAVPDDTASTEDAAKKQQSDSIVGATTSASEPAAKVVKAGAPTELEDATKEKALWSCVIDFMDNDMRDMFRMRTPASKDVLEEIEFENLWYLYSPGDLVYHKYAIGGRPRHRAYRVLFVTGGREILDTSNRAEVSLSTYGEKFTDSFEDLSDKLNEHRTMKGKTKGKTPLIIDCFYIDFDGDHWGPRPRRFVIPEFPRSKPMKALEVVPVRFMPDWATIKSELVDRGKRFVDTAVGTHMLYSGRDHPDRWLSTTTEEVNCEVVIDQGAGIAHLQKISRWDSLWLSDMGGGVIASPTPFD